MVRTQLHPTHGFYPCEDGEPLAESYEYLYALLVTFNILTQYLKGQQAMVLADQSPNGASLT